MEVGLRGAQMHIGSSLREEIVAFICDRGYLLLAMEGKTYMVQQIPTFSVSSKVEPQNKGYWILWYLRMCSLTRCSTSMRVINNCSG